jgi:DNA-binding SARP family transcriptional activator
MQPVIPIAAPTSDQDDRRPAKTGFRIRLLGSPSISGQDGTLKRPRGNKAWGLLAYLLLSMHAPSREALAELLFRDAYDPLSALRWNLAELRRALGPNVSIGGDPVRITLPAEAAVDVWQLTRGEWREGLETLAGAGELLGGVALDVSAVYEIWLLSERRRLSGAAAALLREGVHARFAAGNVRGAVELARGLVDRDPLDEGAQELLVRALAASGDRDAARHQQRQAIDLIARELGTEPGPALRAAAEPPPAASAGAGGMRAAAAARLEAGDAAMAAGASEAGIRSLRDAVAAAEVADDAALRARALVALGAALIHGMRGFDGEAAGFLHEAAKAAAEVGDPEVGARAARELGYIEMLRGRYDRADRWLEQAIGLATGYPGELAWGYAVRGAARGDRGQHRLARQDLDLALELGRDHELPDVEAWALTFRGRGQLMVDDLAAARADLEAAAAAAVRARWTAFVPLPMAFLADVSRRQGRRPEAEGAYERAFALALQLDDPCWEGIAGRGLGLIAADRGDREVAFDRLVTARQRCVRLPDAWLWVEAYCLDALAALAVAEDPGRAEAWIADLEGLAARTGMRELVAHAYLHRARLGDLDAARAVVVLAAEVENPSLLREGAAVLP